MSKRKKYQLKTADFPLSRSLTDSFIADLNAVLLEDGSVEASYLHSTFLSKFVEIGVSEASERRSRAITKWLKTETTNAVTNKRIQAFGLSLGVFVYPGVSAKRLLDRAANVIAQVLPWTPSLDIAYGGFSGGASTSKTRVHGHPAMKFLDKADITRPAHNLFLDMIRGTRWADQLRLPGMDPRYVKGNVLFTVPKNSEIDRVAAKEPDLNMFLQKSFGNQIRSCLKKVGIDLNNQKINQNLARIGSLTNSLMTIDLSSASDSLSYELVKRLLPPDWFYYLDTVRSPFTEIDGSWHENEMFSSMGNGFTFELESLIFYALTRAVTSLGGFRGQISVYGDDIIAPTDAGSNLVSALSFCGFSVNESKSFMDGPFRESCGKHWHDGLDVSPFYLRRPFLTVSDLILTLNQLVGWASRCIGVMDPRYEVIFRKYADEVPEALWGGDDLSSRTSLVTGDPPRKELVFPQEIIQHFHVGGLLFWLFQALNRSGTDLLSSDGSRSPRFARIKKRSAVFRNDVPVFLIGHEC